eukprot:CAMPEP_0198542498 /NCGR_PEP_ID=MMETSP1462-20131121/57773_1 /TAXON_ID=1333877 /ORGANISM="Brandtodinium nutriculum, Strain RCC3387" /LENGTH=37 /DNA_ID= /DNA_START= /DNA_END= /DNA_ORIENTATION=
MSLWFLPCTEPLGPYMGLSLSPMFLRNPPFSAVPLLE